MRIHFRTNLDEAQREVHTLNQERVFSIVPEIGSKVRFKIWNGKHFDLEVVGVTYNATAHGDTEVELHIPRSYGWSIQEWMDHNKRLRRAED